MLFNLQNSFIFIISFASLKAKDIMILISQSGADIHRNQEKVQCQNIQLTLDGAKI